MTVVFTDRMDALGGMGAQLWGPDVGHLRAARQIQIRKEEDSYFTVEHMFGMFWLWVYGLCGMLAVCVYAGECE